MSNAQEITQPLSTSDRCKPVLDRGDGLRSAPESCALQRPAAPRSPHQPQVSFPTAGLLWRENPSKCYRKSPEKQTKLAPVRISQWPWQSCFLPKPTFFAGPVREDGTRLLPPLFNPTPPLRGLGEQERLCASKLPFISSAASPSRCPGRFYSVCKSPCVVRTTLVATRSRLRAHRWRGPSQASPRRWPWRCSVHMADKTSAWALGPAAASLPSHLRWPSHGHKQVWTRLMAGNRCPQLRWLREASPFLPHSESDIFKQPC